MTQRQTGDQWREKQLDAWFGNWSKKESVLCALYPARADDLSQIVDRCGSHQLPPRLETYEVVQVEHNALSNEKSMVRERVVPPL